MTQNERRRVTQPIWARAVILFVTLLVFAGCGDSGNDFVATNNNVNPATTGNLVFNFAKAQTVTTVPADTVSLRFKFYASTDATGTPLFTETRAFATQIVFENVEPEVQSVRVTALGAGNVPLFEATSSFAVALGASINVNLTNGAAVTLAAVNVSPATVTIDVGDTQTFTANATYSNGDILTNVAATWDSSNDAFATINATTGVATGVADGDVTITADVDGVQGDAALTVDQGLVLTSIVVSPDGQSILAGGSLQFTVAGFDQNGDPIAIANPVTWSLTVNNAGAASINTTSGLVSSVDQDLDSTATITATVGALSDNATLNVLANPGMVDALTISINTDTLNFGGGTAQLSNVVGFENGPDVTNSAMVTYQDFDPNVISVSAAGVVTPVAVGTTTITGNIGGFLSAPLAVTVTPAPTNANPTVSITPDSDDVDVDGTYYVNVDNGLQDLDSGPNVTDDQAYLNGGTITVAVTGGPAAFINFNDNSGSPSVASAAGGTGTPLVLTLTSDDTASQSEVESIINNLEIGAAPGAAFGLRTITVTVTDGSGGTGSDTMQAFVRGADADTLVVDVTNTDPDTNFTTITAAIADIAGRAGGEYSTILVRAGDYSAEATLAITNDTDLLGLRLHGSNADNAAGVGQNQPGATWNAETILDNDTTNDVRMTVDNSDIIIRGFTFRVVGGAVDNTDLIRLLDEVDGITIENNVFNGNGLATADLTLGNRGITNNEDAANPPTDVHILNNYITNLAQGVRLTGTPGGPLVTGFEFIGNVVNFNERGVVLRAGIESDALIQGNSFFENHLGDNAAIISAIQVTCDSNKSVTVDGNDIIGLNNAVRYLFFGGQSGVINAQNNHWQAADGSPIANQLLGTTANIDASNFVAGAFFPGTSVTPPTP